MVLWTDLQLGLCSVQLREPQPLAEQGRPLTLTVGGPPNRRGGLWIRAVSRSGSCFQLVPSLWEAHQGPVLALRWDA